LLRNIFPAIYADINKPVMSANITLLCQHT